MTKTVPTSFISPLNDQVRQDFEEHSIELLANSLAEIGQLSPILVEYRGPGKYIIIGGERRWRALNLAGIEFTICNVLRDITQTEFFTIQVHENFHEPIPAKDEARAIKRLWDDSALLGFTYSIPEFAREIRMSETKVRDALNFAENLDPRLQRAVFEGRLPYKIAVKLATIKDKQKQFKLAIEILSDKNGLKVADEKIRNFKEGESSNEQPLFSLTVEEWESNRRLSIEAGVRWAAKQGLAYLQRIIYLSERGWITPRVFHRVEETLVRGLVEAGNEILAKIKQAEDT